MNVTVVGLGYIGLPTAALLARAGHRVLGYDVDAELRRSLRAGLVAALEPPVQIAVNDALRRGTLHIVDALAAADAYIMCLPTPAHNGRPDLHYVETAAEEIAAVAPAGAIVVLESTVPPGATERIVGRAFARHGKSLDDYAVAHCPERVIPGAIVDELLNNARVVGGRTPRDAQIVADLYRSFCFGDVTETTAALAEFVKIIENTYRDVNIAFANELAIVAEELDIDVWEAIALANRHPRVNILSPGPGVGGHCIPVDPNFLSDANPVGTELVQAARRVNDRMPYRVVRRISEMTGQRPGAKIALLGAAYKGDVDDARESPTQRIDELLRQRNYVTAIYDPLVTRFERPLCATLDEALTGAEAMVLVTPHTLFRDVDPARSGELMRRRRLIDTRRFFDAVAWERAGFQTYVLGRPIERVAVPAVA
jgi:UDP-N-acetyl-D-mannosaminuronic acid dehydrogenase